MLLKEYRIAMPLSVEEYRIGQLYMIAKHSNEASEKGQGVEIVKNEPCEDAKFGKGQFTEKRIHLSNKLPTWVQAVTPRIFYITERAWNYYPYTITEFTCSFLPKFSIHIETRYENNNGSTENCLDLDPELLAGREVVHINIGSNEGVQDHKYKETEDPAKFHSEKTGRGPLEEKWRDTSDPVMCSYKVTRVKFEVWGLQTKTESFTHSCVQEILLMGHRQAFTWIDEWFGMTMEELRQYESNMNEETNKKVGIQDLPPVSTEPNTPSNTPVETSEEEKS